MAGAVDPEAEQISFLHLTRRDRKRASVKFTSLTGRSIEVVDVDLSDAPWLGVATREKGAVLWVDLDLLARRLPKDRLSGTDTIALHVQNPWPSVVRLSVHWDRLPATAPAP